MSPTAAASTLVLFATLAAFARATPARADAPPPPAPDPFAPIAPPSQPQPDPLGEPPTVTATTMAPEPPAPPMLVIGLKLGGAINLFNSLGASSSPELEVGVLLPPLDRAFEIFLAGRWASASDDGASAADPRLPGDGVATWSVTRTDVALGLGLRFRVRLDGPFEPYVAAGARLYLLATEVSGAAGGEAFGTNEETGTAVGFLAQLGGELALGPGALLLELAVNGAGIDQTILADTNVSSLDVYLGYRLFF